MNTINLAVTKHKIKSFSVQQFFKNAAEVWASSPDRCPQAAQSELLDDVVHESVFFVVHTRDRLEVVLLVPAVFVGEVGVDVVVGVFVGAFAVGVLLVVGRGLGHAHGVGVDVRRRAILVEAAVVVDVVAGVEGQILVEFELQAVRERQREVL